MEKDQKEFEITNHSAEPERLKCHIVAYFSSIAVQLLPCNGNGNKPARLPRIQVRLGPGKAESSSVIG